MVLNVTKQNLGSIFYGGIMEEAEFRKFPEELYIFLPLLGAP